MMERLLDFINKIWMRGLVSNPQEKPRSFIDYLVNKGFKYDSTQKWWSREWTTNRRKDTCTEVYQHTNPLTKDWSHLMVSTDGRIFFQEKNVNIDDFFNS